MADSPFASPQLVGLEGSSFEEETVSKLIVHSAKVLGAEDADSRASQAPALATLAQAATPAAQADSSGTPTRQAAHAKCMGSSWCKHRGTCTGNAYRGWLKGLLAGYAIKGGLNLVTGVLFRRLHRRPLLLLKTVLGADSTKFALFWSFFTGGFKALQCVLRRLRQTNDRWNAFLSGTVASAAVLLDDPERHTTWALWMLTRALDLLYRSYANLGVLPSLYHGDLLVFSVTAAVVMYAWHMHPNAIPSGYHKWISARGGLDDRIITGMRMIVTGQRPDMVSWCEDNKIPVWNPEEPPTIMPCEVFHPQLPWSCTVHALQRWVLGFRSGLPVYSVVHLLPLLLFRIKKLFQDPLKVAATTSLSIFYSTSFITSFQTFFWLSFCQTRHLLGRDSRWSTIVAGICAGFSLLCERKSRRHELALFTVPRALDGTFKIMVEKGFAKVVPYGNVALFSLAMGFVMMFYQHEPSTIKPTYYKLMQKYFGMN